MEDIYTTMKDYVLILDSSIVDDDLLDFAVEEVVDKVLIYTNRHQLIDEDDGDSYRIAFPIVFDRVVAKLVLRVYKNNEALKDDTYSATSVKDHGQSVDFGERLKSSLLAGDDVLETATSLLQTFRLANVSDAD